MPRKRDADLVPADDGAHDALVADLRRIIDEGRGRAAAAINTEIVQTYWKIGERIIQEEQGGVERAGYGDRLLAQLGRLLSAEHGRAFGQRNLYFMRQFYLAYPIVNALRTQLTWTHYRTLMRLPDDQRAFYEGLVVTGRWSSRELEKQINSMLHVRAGLARSPAELARTLPMRTDPVRSYDDAFKDPYVLDVRRSTAWCIPL